MAMEPGSVRGEEVKVLAGEKENLNLLKELKDMICASFEKKTDEVAVDKGKGSFDNVLDELLDVQADIRTEIGDMHRIIRDKVISKIHFISKEER